MNLAEMLATVQKATPEQFKDMVEGTNKLTGSMPWIPNPGPQSDAYWSKADVLLFGGEPGGGKAVHVSTPIPTYYGWSTMEEMDVGDRVFAENGDVCQVVGKSPVFTEDTYRLTFSDGSEVIAGARHQWVTSNRAERQRKLKCNDGYRARRRATRPLRGTGKKPWLAELNTKNAKSQNLPFSSIKTTETIAETIHRYDGGLNHAVGVAGSLCLPESKLLIEPYVLGAWLGDGCSSSGAIAGIDEEIFSEVANSYEVSLHVNPYSRGVWGLMGDLRQLGVLGNKHIPAAYLRSSHEQRLELLQGLMDTDGHCDKRGQCEIQLTRKALIDGVQELIHSLGIKVEMHEGEAKLYGRVTGPKWRLKFMTDLPAFKLARKLIRQKRSGFRGTHNQRYITSCELIDPVPLQCIQVDSPSHCYLVGKSMIPTHNSNLALGLAFNLHQRSLIARRNYGDLARLIDDAVEIRGSKVGLNQSPPPKFRIAEGKTIDFFAANRVGDERARMGQGVDLFVADESTHFAESQIKFLMGWVRSEDPNQRCRTVLPTNPPLTAEGLWVIQMFAPWLNPQFPHPAKPGELRWVITDADGNDQWVTGPGEYPTEVAGVIKMVEAKSRSYIPSSVQDNPYYAESGYQKELDAMPEPYRSLLMGGFKTAFQDQPNQIIPTEWVTQAQVRWLPQPPMNVPMCTMGVDASGGSTDPMIIAPRYDGWFAPMIEIPAKEIPMERSGSYCAGQIISFRRDGALVVIDLGGGYGGPTYEHLIENHVEVRGYKGAEASTRRSKDGKLRFTNKRTAALWVFREALDPGQPGGSPIALPMDPVLMADLTAPTFSVTPNGIKAESKEHVCDRLGRSTDKGDATIMSWFEGPKETTHALEWMDRAEARNMHGMRPKVVSSGRKPLSARGRR